MNASARDEVALAGTDLRVRPLGRTPYESTWRAMQAFTAGRTPEAPDEIWITEHEPVYTLGLTGRPQHVRDVRGIPVLKVDRGGQVTYHGPGQLIVYVLLDLRRSRTGVRALVRALEGAVIDWLAMQEITAYGKESAPGVYTRVGGAEAKIGALGLRVRNGCTYHGLSLNVNMDLAPFLDIDPCGYPGLAVTQVADFVDPPSLERAGQELAQHVASHVARAGH